MKTKLIHISLIFALLTVANISCKDYLVEDNKTGATEDVIYSTRSGIDGLLAGSYSYLRGWYGKQQGIYLSELGTDIWLHDYVNNESTLVNYSNISPEVVTRAMNPMFDEYWEMFYAAINTCNLGLKNVDKISSSVLSEADKNTYTGELKALRAFYYWHLVETWGAVQINREPINGVLTTASRSSVEDVYAFMLEDIDDAIARLAGKTSKTGHINLWAAKAMKARFLLYKASKFNDKQAYADAAAQAEEVISGSGLSFYPDAAECWNGPNENGLVNKEVIWWVDYSEVLENNILPKRLKFDTDGHPLTWTDALSDQGGNTSHLYYCGVWNMLPGLSGILVRTKDEASKIVKYNGVDYNVGLAYQPYSRGYTDIAPSGFFLDLFNDATDQRYQAYFRDTWYVAPVFQKAFASGVEPPEGFHNLRDTAIHMSKARVTPAGLIARAKNRYILFSRTDAGDPDVHPLYEDADGKYQTLMLGGGGGEQNFKGELMFIQFRKNDDLNSSTIGTMSGRDVFVFRLAEMYLIAAEGYMMSGSSTEAIKKLNALRSVRAIPSGSDVNNLSAAEMAQVTGGDINVILDERARELCGEQMRWFDLERTGKLIERVKLHNGIASEYIDEHHTLRPIPVTQMDAITNKTAGPDPNGFWQNPGY